MFTGTLRLRDQVNSAEDKITAMRLFDRGRWTTGDHLTATMIGKLWGLTHAHVGDALGEW